MRGEVVGREMGWAVSVGCVGGAGVGRVGAVRAERAGGGQGVVGGRGEALGRAGGRRRSRSARSARSAGGLVVGGRSGWGACVRVGAGGGEGGEEEGEEEEEEGPTLGELLALPGNDEDDVGRQSRAVLAVPEERYVPMQLRHRPMRFAEMVGNEVVRTALAGCVASGRVAGAYLFAGPRGSGKTTLARIFARAINCEEPGEDGEPCGGCAACLRLGRDGPGTLLGGMSDVVEQDAASNNGVDAMRELVDVARLYPMMGKYRVFIMDECHMLTNEAANAFLKTLEQPPPRTVFMLVTTHPGKLPLTVLSRCLRFDLRPPGRDALAERLADLAERDGFAASADACRSIAELGGGPVRDAEALLERCCILAAAEARGKGLNVEVDRVEIDAGLVRRTVGEADWAGSALRARGSAALEEDADAGGLEDAAARDIAALVDACRGGGDAGVLRILNLVKLLIHERGWEPAAVLAACAARVTVMLKGAAAPSVPGGPPPLGRQGAAWCLSALATLGDAEVQVRHSTMPSIWAEAALLRLVPPENVEGGGNHPGQGAPIHGNSGGPNYPQSQGSGPGNNFGGPTGAPGGSPGRGRQQQQWQQENDMGAVWANRRQAPQTQPAGGHRQQQQQSSPHAAPSFTTTGGGDRAPGLRGGSLTLEQLSMLWLDAVGCIEIPSARSLFKQQVALTVLEMAADGSRHLATLEVRTSSFMKPVQDRMGIASEALAMRLGDGLPVQVVVQVGGAAVSPSPQSSAVVAPRDASRAEPNVDQSRSGSSVSRSRPGGRQPQAAGTTRQTLLQRPGPSPREGVDDGGSVLARGAAVARKSAEQARAEVKWNEFAMDEGEIVPLEFPAPSPAGEREETSTGSLERGSGKESKSRGSGGSGSGLSAEEAMMWSQGASLSDLGISLPPSDPEIVNASSSGVGDLAPRVGLTNPTTPGPKAAASLFPENLPSELYDDDDDQAASLQIPADAGAASPSSSSAASEPLVGEKGGPDTAAGAEQGAADAFARAFGGIVLDE